MATVTVRVLSALPEFGAAAGDVIPLDKIEASALLQQGRVELKIPVGAGTAGKAGKDEKNP